ncbi:MAG: TonB-dependent receptor [Saprospiraceae bacterium]|nr:TonB-dependent receptor [Saprospiraceae bacterium]
MRKNRLFVVLSLLLTQMPLQSIPLMAETMYETEAPLRSAHSIVASIRGQVRMTDAELMPNVKVTVKGTNRSVSTDINGQFVIDAEVGDVLVFSLLGYKTKEVPVGNGSFLNVVIEEQAALGSVAKTVIGSRDQTRTEGETPVAVDIIPIKDVVNQTGEIELNRILHILAPSFNANRQTGADAADHVDPSSLRGLGPDQTLFLVNGKRYHPSALINVFGTRGRGNAGTDLNSIPASAVDHIEILRDGAAAQYGSDAVAGVINIVLKSGQTGTTGSVGYGSNVTGWGSSLSYENFGKILPKTTDGGMLNANVTHGFAVGKAQFSITADYMSKGKAIRPNNETAFPDENYRDGASYASLSNMSAYLNGKIALNKGELYAFGGYSFRKTDMFLWTIPAEDDLSRAVPEIYPGNYNPHLLSDISNFTATLGYKTQLGKWNFDLSNTWGKNNVHLFMTNTLNPSLGAKSPTSFDNGGYGIRQNTLNLDLDRKFDKILSGLNLAFGAEYRQEAYHIFAGDEASWKTYPSTPIIVTNANGTKDTITRGGSSQGFPGFRPDQALDETRNVIGIYTDGELSVNKNFLLTGALRFENYSDFGSAFGGKLATLWRINNTLSLRGSIQTGFRAPSLAQVYFRSTINDVDADGNNFEKVVFNNRSDLTKKLGIPSLKAETSVNTGLGFVYRPNDKFSLSVDAYQINVQDRIVLTGAFFQDDNIIGAELKKLEVKAAQFYTNALDTKTQGLDIAASYKAPLSKGTLSFTLGGNINKMELTDVKTAPNLANKKDKYISLRELQFILSSAPRSKGQLGITYALDKWQVTLRNAYFSSVEFIGTKGILGFDPDLDKLLSSGREAEWRAIVTDVYKPRVVTDLIVNYALTKNLTWAIGGNNIFDVYPTIQNSGSTDGGTHWDGVQMGMSGAYFFTRVNVKF